jgi:hypothetical protein|tara:strand:- start:228 stop:632 length:405 start_codon:yes stop_codon:yes gene_type:complete
MATQVQFRRGTTGEHSGFTGAVGEVTVDTEKKVLCIHDATTAGGFPLLREDFSNSNLSLGSLGSCALKFVNDPDTGIMSTGQDQIQLVTGGVARLTIDSSGTITIPSNLIVSGNLTVTGELDSGNQIALILALG